MKCGRAREGYVCTLEAHHSMMDYHICEGKEGWPLALWIGNGPLHIVRRDR